MKKLVLVVMVFFMLFFVPSVQAETVDTIGVSVMIDNCNTTDGLDVEFDILIDSTLHGNLVQSDISPDYINSHPSYDLYSFLAMGDYRSYRAYVEDNYTEDDYTCLKTITLDHMSTVESFYLVIYDAQTGYVYKNEPHLLEDLRMDSEDAFGNGEHFTYYVDDNSIMIEYEPVFFESYGILRVLIVFLIFPVIGLIIFTYAVTAFYIRRYAITENKGKYIMGYLSLLIMTVVLTNVLTRYQVLYSNMFITITSYNIVTFIGNFF